MPDLIPRKIAGYGWKPDIPDIRDFSFAPNLDQSKVFPKIFSLRSTANVLALPYDQLNVGACVGNSTGFAVQFERGQQKLSNFTPSRLFIYFGARTLEGTSAEDSGAQIRDGMKVIASLGAPPESTWLYDPAKFADTPPQAAYDAGKLDRALVYMRCRRSMYAFKEAISSDHPIVFGFSVYASFESDAAMKTGMIPMPQASESLLGGHAVAMIGWDDDRHLVEVRNSWGPNVQDAGHFWLPAAYVLDPNLSSDFWVIKTMDQAIP